jgi:hypothetical protein
MNKVYTNNLQSIITNEGCDSTYTPNLGEFTSTNTIHENIKIYYEISNDGS